MDRVPFNKAELEVKAYRSGRLGQQTPILSTPITPKENWLMYLRGEKPLWIPSPSDSVNLTPAIVADNISRGFVFDDTAFDPNTQAGGPDMFGVEWEWVPGVNGSMVRPGNPKVKDITEWEKDIVFPDLDSWDWEGSAKLNEKSINDPDRLIGVTIMNGMFERLISFIDMNDAMISMVDEDMQEGVHRLFSALADFYIKLIAKFKQYYKIDLVTFHDDWGSQRAPFFSCDTVSEMIVPYLKRIIDGAHELGVYFELHSCGKNELLVPAMIEAGVDMWSGQPMNDKLMLCEKYADKIRLGAAPTDIDANSTPEEVRASYEKFVETFKDFNIYGGFTMGVPGAYELLYELSRKAYCGEA